MVTSSQTSQSAGATSSKKNGKVKLYPAPQKLATPSYLKPEQAQAVVEAVNPLIADAFALYTKTKNYHWHLSGSHFRDYHLLFQEQAEEVFETIDPLAERMRRIGGTTIRSISQISQLQMIEDDNDEFVPPEQMIQRLLDDNRQIAQRQFNAIETCDQNNDKTTANLLEEVLNQTERRVWFLYEISQGGEYMN
jgi:starvation-inducible DNA-binding protein